VQMSDRLNIDHLEHLLSSLTPKLLLEVRVMDWVLGVVPFLGITARSTGMRTFFWTYAQFRLSRYSAVLMAPSDILMRRSLYQRRYVSRISMNSGIVTPCQDLP